MRLIFLLTLAIGLIPMTSSIAKPDEPTILSVDAVSVAILKEKPRILKLEASGKVATAGWSDARLLRVIPLSPPPDGIYDVKVIAIKPADAPDAVTPIAVRPLIWRLYPQDVKAVRFYSQKNCLIAVLPGVDKSTVPAGPCTIK